MNHPLLNANLDQTHCACGAQSFNVALYLEVSISTRTRTGLQLHDPTITPSDALEAWCSTCGRTVTDQGLDTTSHQRLAFVEAATTHLLRSMVPVQRQHLTAP